MQFFVYKMEIEQNGNHLQYIKEEDVKLILRKYGYNKDEVVIDDFVTYNASSKMLGFLADYWKLKVNISLKNGHREVLSFFIKAVSKSNAAKAIMVRELKLFQKEVFFYSILKDRMDVSGKNYLCFCFTIKMK